MEQPETSQATPPTTEQSNPPAEGTPPVETKTEAEEAPVPLTAADIKLPEGFEAPEEMLSSFAELLNDSNLSAAERAEKLVNLHAEAMKTASEKISEDWQKTREAWVDQVKNDPDIGGDKLEGSLADIAKLVDEFGGQEFRDVMDESGLGDHPVIVKFLHKIAKSFAEGKPVSGTPSGGTKTIADRLYPNQGA